MKLDRFRAPALAAGAVLLISGAGIAFAGSPAPATPSPVAPVVGPEPADVGESANEATGPDTDNLQEGDQTTPDAVGAAVSAAKVNAATVAGAEADGPGGHEDPSGQNVDHQFEGVE